MKVAVIQMVSGGDVAANLRQARTLLEQAAQAQTDIQSILQNITAQDVKQE